MASKTLTNPSYLPFGNSCDRPSNHIPVPVHVAVVHVSPFPVRAFLSPSHRALEHAPAAPETLLSPFLWVIVAVMPVDSRRSERRDVKRCPCQQWCGGGMEKGRADVGSRGL